MFKIENKDIRNEAERANKDSEKDPVVPISIPTVLRKIDEDEWVIPEFQRDFVWSIEKFKLLFDSIFRGYTIGNLLLWKSTENLAYRKVSGKEPIKKNNNKKHCYILDGQQRLTTLYSILKDKDIHKSDRVKPQKYKIYFDTITSSFLSWRDKLKIDGTEYKVGDLIENNKFRFIDLSQIFDEKLRFPDNLIEPERRRIQKELKKKENVDQLLEENEILENNKKILEEFSNVIKSYKIHRIEEEEDLSKVINVFERINTQNVTLDIFDIMVAKTYRTISYGGYEKTFNLRNAIQKILYSGIELDKDKLDPEVELKYSKDNYYNIDNTTILRLISIIHNLNNKKRSGLQKNHIYDLDAQYIQNNIMEFRKILKNLLKYLSNELNIKTLDIKFTDNKILSFLTAVISPYKYSDLNKEGKKEVITKWFWNTVIFNRYPGAQLQRIETDISEFSRGIRYFSEHIKNNRTLGIFNKKHKFRDKYLINAGYDNQNYLYKSLILLLNSLKPIDFNVNSEINLMEYFGAYTKNNKHHIVPFKSKAADKLREEMGKEKAEILLNNVGNIAIISEDLNQEIKKRNPEDYLPEFESNENFEKFLKTHLIDKNMYDVLVKEKDYEKFILLRNKAIINLIKNKCTVSDENIIFEEDYEGL